MKYKMIISDFDGTLCCSDNTLSKKNVEAVKDYVSRGGIFVICSGRMNKSVEKYVRELGIENQAISVAGFQGGWVVDKFGKEIINTAIDSQTSKRIIEFSESKGLYVHTYDFNDTLIEKEHPIATEYQNLCGVTLKEVGRLSRFVEENEVKCPKILTVVASEDVHAFEEELKSMELPGVAIVRSHENFVEAVPMGGGKANALIKIAEYYGIDVSDVIAVGDQENDIQMVVTAGLGCCTGNAIDDLKRVSDFVANDCNHDAIAQIIEKFTLD